MTGRVADVKGARSIFVAVPVYRAVDASFMVSLLGLLAKPPAGLEFTLRVLPGDSLVTRARNTLTAWFLDTEAEALLWLDSDLVFSPEMIARLCSHDEPVVAGMYPLKCDSDGTIEWCLNALPGAQRRADGLLPVRYAGTGAMLIKREVFRQIFMAGLALPYWCDGQRSAVHHDFWRVGVNGASAEPGNYLSEDWFFCEWCQQLGIPVYVDTQTIFRHVGQEAFPTQRQMEYRAAGLVRAEADGMRLVVSQAMARHAAKVLKGEYAVGGLPRSPRTVLDLGANEGAFTAWARKQWPYATVEAFEPVPENAERFRANHGRDAQVRLTVAAVGGVTELRRGRNNSGECSAYDLGEQAGEFVPVASVLPETLPACEFVKVDCEGMELEILQGLDTSAALAVVLEYHRVHEVGAIGAVLERRGFALQREQVTGNDRGILVFVRKS